MNCIYCHKILPNEDGDRKTFRCDNCLDSGWDVRFKCSLVKEQLEVGWLAIFSVPNGRYVEIDLVDTQIRVFDWDTVQGYSRYEWVTHLDRLEFLSPINIQVWLNRIFNLKAFF